MLAVPDEDNVFQFVIFGNPPMGSQKVYTHSNSCSWAPIYLTPIW